MYMSKDACPERTVADLLWVMTDDHRKRCKCNRDVGQQVWFLDRMESQDALASFRQTEEDLLPPDCALRDLKTRIASPRTVHLLVETIGARSSLLPL